MDRASLPTRVIRLRPGERWPDDDARADELTVEERLGCVWPWTEEAYQLAGGLGAEARRQRHVVRLERRGR